MTPTKTRLAIHGAAGRMGKRLIALGSADPAIDIVAAIESDKHPAIGEDAGVAAGVGSINLVFAPNLCGNPQALIDFSVPAGAEAAIKLCVENKVPLVMATTGLSEAQRQMIRDAAKTIPVVWSPSMSLAVNITMKLTEIAGKALRNVPSGADVEIIERHHRFKEDSPSGTALKFGDIVAAAMGQSEHRHGREGAVGQRPHNEIGYHAVRVGDNPGEHTIIFGMLGETIELTVRASNRDCYAVGALLAAQFVAKQAPGLYSMSEVLGL